MSNVSFAYGYEPSSYSLLKTVTGPAHTVTNTFEDKRDILKSKENEAGTTVVSSYAYTVNEIGQRTNLTTQFNLGAGVTANPGDVEWGYDSLGQVTSADHTIPGLDRAYQFDLIGNRLKSADSLTLPTANNYTPTPLNQYEAIGTLNPEYDFDGNATAYPLPANLSANSTLGWDAENRLTSASVPGGGTVTFVYDAQSRRIAETVGTTTKVTLYDGWNPVAQYTGSVGVSPTLTKTYTWGMDLSGTMQGAGGVGGLLAVTDSTGTYYPTYDGNGNVSEYLDSTGAAVAHYEYDPFGKTIVASGSKAQDFSHRFSTKPLDATTGLYYYGYRYYDPVTGRWPSRDPIEENGGINLYAFVGNNGIGFVDDLGMKRIHSVRKSKYYSLDADFYYFDIEYSGDCYDYENMLGYSSPTSCCTGDIEVKLTISVASKWTTEELATNIMVGLKGYNIAYQKAGGIPTPLGKGPRLTDAFTDYRTRNSVITLGKVPCGGGTRSGTIELGYISPTYFTEAINVSWGIEVVNCGEVRASCIQAKNDTFYMGPERSKIREKDSNKGIDPIVGENTLEIR